MGRTTPEELMRTNGVVAFKDRKGRRMEIFRCDTADYDRVMRRFRSALAAGPVLDVYKRQLRTVRWHG